MPLFPEKRNNKAGNKWGKKKRMEVREKRAQRG